MTEPLKGQVAIITGGSRGIGLAIAQAFAAEGIAMALVARSEAAVRRASETIQTAGGRAIPFPANVTDQRAVDRVVAETVRQLGPVDLLINNAGSAHAIGPIWELSPRHLVAGRHDESAGHISVQSRCPARDDCSPPRQNHQRRQRPWDTHERREHAVALRARLQQQQGRGDRVDAESWDHGTGARCRLFGFRPGFVRTALLEEGARSPAGRRWVPEVQALLDSDRLVPAALAGRWVTFLASGAVDDLSGRVLSVTHDMNTLAARSDEIRREGRYMLRLID